MSKAKVEDVLKEGLTELALEEERELLIASLYHLHQNLSSWALSTQLKPLRREIESFLLAKLKERI